MGGDSLYRHPATPKKYMKEYTYEVRVLDSETNELVFKGTYFSQESMEEELGKSKIKAAIERHETLSDESKLDAEEERFDRETEQ